MKKQIRLFYFDIITITRDRKRQQIYKILLEVCCSFCRLLGNNTQMEYYYELLNGSNFTSLRKQHNLWNIMYHSRDKHFLKLWIYCIDKTRNIYVYAATPRPFHGFLSWEISKGTILECIYTCISPTV